MSGEYYIAEEDIAIPQHLVDTAFRNGLRSLKLLYLDELKSLALSDSFFEGQHDLLEKAFQDMKIYLGNQGPQMVNHISMRQFKLPTKMIDRLGYLAHQGSIKSPINDSSKSSKTARWSDRSPSIQSEDNYDDDFEAEEVEEEDEHDHHHHHHGYHRDTGGNSGKQQSGSSIRYNNNNHYPSSSSTSTSNKMNSSNTITKLTNNFVGGNTPSPTKMSMASNSNPYQSTRGNDNNVPKGRLQVIGEEKTSAFREPTPRESVVTSRIQPQPTQSVDFSCRTSPSNKYFTTQPADNATQSRKYSKQPQWIDAKEWRLGEKIGSGSFGEVFQAMNHKGKLYAVKKMNIIDKSTEVKNLIQEIRLMSVLSHKNIVQYLGSWVDEEEGSLYIFQEWVPGGSVAHLLKQFGPFSVTTVRFYTRQILAGLQYLHSNHIIHRDIKGGNILVDDSGTVKLADFGASTTLNDFNKTQETTTIKGTPYFMAPEVLSTSKYGRKGDIWAVGCTMIQMFTGEPPWKDQNLKSLIQLHILLSGWNKGPPPYNVKLPDDAKECLELCFRKDPDDRPTASELLHCQYLRDNDDLDDSYNMDQSFYRNRGDGGSGYGGGLGDSGLINKLESAIDSAVSKSRTSLAIHSRGYGGVGAAGAGAGLGAGSTTTGPGQSEDTFEVIEKRMKEKASSSGKGNNNYNNNPYETRGREGSSSPSSGTPTRRVNDNPFGKNAGGGGGGGPVKPSNIIAPFPIDYATSRRDTEPSSGSTSGNPTPRWSNDPTSHAANPSSSSSSHPSYSEVNSSVHLIKKKINEATTVKGNSNSPGRSSNSRSTSRTNSPRTGPGGVGMSISHRYGAGGNNQSSNRDSEDLTPQAYDLDDDYDHDHYPYRRSTSGPSSGTGTGTGTGGPRSANSRGRSESYDSPGEDTYTPARRGGGGSSGVGVGRIYPLEKHDTRYFEQKQQDFGDEPTVSTRRKERDRDREIGGRDDSHERTDDESKRRDSYSSNDELTYQGYGYSAGHHHAQHTNHNVPSSSASSSSRRPSYPVSGNTGSGDTRDSSKYTSANVIRKSSSTADSIGSTPASGTTKPNVVPRLTQVEYSSDRPIASNAAKSISARVTRNVEPIDSHSHHRPFTSKAALGGPQVKRNPNASSGANTGESNLIKKATHQAALQQHFPDHGSGGDAEADEGVMEAWNCLKCGATNTNPNYCDYCATVRGTSGKKDLKTPLSKR